MRKRFQQGAAAAMAATLSLVPVAKSEGSNRRARDTQASSTAPRGWKLVWHDEFDQPDGSPPDPTKWTYDIGVGGDGWGNNELEYYTNSARNASVRGGKLAITAIKEKYTGPDKSQDGPAAAASGAMTSQVARDYTSARLKTQGLFAQAYGRFEARIKIPAGQGVWPAFWMLGADIDKVEWPRSGEIDIMENVGKEPSKVHGSVHGPGPSSPKTDDLTGTYALPGAERFSDAFHVFSLEWEPKVVRFYVDDHLYETATPDELPHHTGWVFDHPFFVLLNLAIGGDWPGSPDDSTKFPSQMLVDYVRVYSRQ